MERSYRSPSVLTRASGTLPLTVQIACWISSRNPALPVRLLRMANVTRARNVDPVTPEVLHQHWPVDDRRRRPLHAVIVDVCGDAHDLAPRACRILTDAPAERGFGRPPVLARKILGHHHDRPVLIDVVPREVAARHDRRPHGGEEPRRHELEAPNRCAARLAGRRIFDEGRFVGPVLERRGVGEGDGGDSRDRCEPIAHGGLLAQ